MDSLFDLTSKSTPGAIERLIASGEQVDDMDKYGRTPLFKAACLGYYACADALIKAGANIMHRDNEGNSALLIAAYSGIESSVDYLIKVGCDPLAKNNAQQSASDVLLSNFFIDEPALHSMLTKFSNLGVDINLENKLPERTQGYLDNWLKANPKRD